MVLESSGLEVQNVATSRRLLIRVRANSAYLSALSDTFATDQHPTPQSVHHTQEVDPVYNPGGQTDPYNADCGPTSLVMGLEMLGLQVPGAGSTASVQDRIDRSRQVIFADQPDSDGIGPNGQRSIKEHGIATSMGRLAQAAQQAGASTHFVSGVRQIQEAVQAGSPVLATGNPQARGSYGQRAGIDATSHIVAITGYNNRSHNFTVNDPLSHQGPLQVSQSELSVFLSRGQGNGYGLVLERSENH